MNSPKHPHIPMTAVKSSQIESIGHSGDTLAVKFKHGGEYRYHGVSAEKFAEMQKSESIGKYLGAHIRGKHDFVKLEQEKV